MSEDEFDEAMLVLVCIALAVMAIGYLALGVDILARP